eukprot:840778_1
MRRYLRNNRIRIPLYNDRESILGIVLLLILIDVSNNWYCMCPSGARTVNPCAHVIAILMFIFLVRSNRLDHPLITHPSEPINCARYERYAKCCPCSWARPPPKPPVPSDINDTAINIDVNMADGVDNDSSDNEDHVDEEKEALLIFPGDATDSLLRNNANNIIISDRNTFQSLHDNGDHSNIYIETDEESYGGDDADSYCPMVSDNASDNHNTDNDSFCNSNVSNHPSDDDIIHEMDVAPGSLYSKQMDESDGGGPPPKKRRYNTRSGDN